MTTGDIYAVAAPGAAGFFGDGGPATAASMCPVQVAGGPGGEVLLTDFTCDRIRVISE